MSRVPRIRFKGFEEDWEQRKLKYFADYKSSSLTVKDCKEEGKYDLYDANQVIGKTDKFVIDEDYITIIKDGAGVGRTRKLSKNTAFIGTMGALTVNNSDLDFLYATLNRIDWNTKTFGSTIPHIYFKDYGEKVYGEPSIEEQKKIGLYFKNIDTLITLHQRKLEKLKIIKKSMLENLFPQNGEKTPKIRFSGFNEDWEQRKLGEMVEFYNGDRSSRYPNDSDMVFEGIPFINAGDLVLGRVKLDTANKITEEKYNQLSGAKIQCGDIIYCLRGTLGKNAFVDNFDIGTIASSLVDIRPQKIVGKYLFQVLNSDIEYSQRILNDEGAAQPNLSAKNLYLFDIPIPRDVEQIKIAEYLESLDHLITLHQSKLEKLQKIKKSMLESMFV